MGQYGASAMFSIEISISLRYIRDVTNKSKDGGRSLKPPLNKRTQTKRNKVSPTTVLNQHYNTT